MLGDIPSDWDSKSLAAVLSEHYPGDWGEDRGPHMTKVLRSTNLTKDGRLDLENAALRALPQRKANLLAPRRHDILLERSGGGPGQPVGRVGFVEADMPGHAFSNFLHLLRPDPEEINPRFLGWVLYRINRTGRIIRLEQQTTQMRNLNFRDYLTMPLPVPPPDEQAAIARIIDAVDTALERTRAAVERARALRRALMQELLPPWIGLRELTGSQKPAGVEEIVRADVVTDVCNGSTPSRLEGRYWRQGTIPWLPTGKVHDRIITAADEFVTEAALRECSIRLLPRGTVLVGMIGQGRTRGMSAYLDIEACINQNFGAFTPRPVPTLRVWGKWLFYFLDFHYSRVREVGGGTNQGALNCYLLKRLRLPLPALDRQKEVAAILEGVESLEKARLTALTIWGDLKKSLMHDLLTGRVRVTNEIKVATS
jgi:type I restriction enzyme S subunit